jgi:hypothetical protein
LNKSCRLRISVGTPAIVIHIFIVRIYKQIPGHYLRIGHSHILRGPLQFSIHYYLVTRRYISLRLQSPCIKTMSGTANSPTGLFRPQLYETILRSLCYFFPCGFQCSCFLGVRSGDILCKCCQYFVAIYIKYIKLVSLTSSFTFYSIYNPSRDVCNIYLHYNIHINYGYQQQS